MSDLLVLGLKLLFLALLWLFVIFALSVIRTDLFGRRLAADAVGVLDAAEPVRRGRRGKKLPTTLRVTSGAQAGASLPLSDAIVIGRTPDSTLDLGDEFMSSRHAVISRTPTGYVVEDLGSTNGTFVNERRISTPTPLKPSDVLRIGRTTLTVDR